MNSVTAAIPIELRIHLGDPNEDAYNITVSFLEYIKNVASSELYPTWPEAALRANISAQITFTINRIYTRYYRNQGYDFDITSSPKNDQSYTHGRNIFTNINFYVNEMFDQYLSYIDSADPILSVSCNDVSDTCNGLSKWGSVALALQGYNYFEILKYYFGEDLAIVRNTPVISPTMEYPGVALRPGDAGNAVLNLQIQMNRISECFRSIPKINPISGIYDEGTSNTIYQFRSIFNLFQKSVVDKPTWYEISFAYMNARWLADLRQNSLLFNGLPQQYVTSLSVGTVGFDVKLVQYYLNVLAFVAPVFQRHRINGIYGPEMAQCVMILQKSFSLPVTGIVDERTWNLLFNIYSTWFTINEPANILTATQIYPGNVLSQGSTGEPVAAIQFYLTEIAKLYSVIPAPPVDGIYGASTGAAVTAFQNLFALEETGTVNERVWQEITSLYSDIITAFVPKKRQFPGYTLKEGMSDFENIYALQSNSDS